MSTLTNIENAISVGEHDVIAFFTTVYNDAKALEQTLATDFLDVLQWVEAHGTQISQIAMTAISTAVAAGVGVPPAVITASTLLANGVASVQSAIAAAQAAAAQGKGVATQAIDAASTAYQTFNNAKNALVAAPKTAAG